MTYSFERPWPSPKRHDYTVGLELDVVNDVISCVGIAVRAAKPNRRVSGSTLRELPVASLVSEAMVKLHNAAIAAQMDPGEVGLVLVDGELQPADDEFLANRAAFWTKAAKEGAALAPLIAKSRKAPKGRRWPADHLATVAKQYKQAVRDGLEPGPTVAEIHNVTVATATNWFYRARQRGLLPPVKPPQARRQRGRYEEVAMKGTTVPIRTRERVKP